MTWRAGGHVGLLYVSGELARTLRPGFHAVFAVEHGVAVELFDTRVNTLEVSGQEIVTKDKVRPRINLTTPYHPTDVETAVRAVKDSLDYLYKEVQFGLRGAVDTRTLGALLEDKEVIDHSVADYLKERIKALGITVKSVGVKNIILPGDMRELLAKVVEAEKAAQANVIRRREETNATRRQGRGIHHADVVQALRRLLNRLENPPRHDCPPTPREPVTSPAARRFARAYP